MDIFKILFIKQKLTNSKMNVSLNAKGIEVHV